MRLVIVDDSNILVAKLMNLLHQYEGIEIIDYANNYAEAVKKISATDCDLIFLDIKLPDGNGIDLINFIKYCSPSSKIAMLSNYTYPVMKKRCKELGADYFFDKTSDIDNVIKIATGQMIEQTGFEGV